MTFEKLAVFYRTRGNRVTKRIVSGVLVFDTKDCGDATYLPAKLYVTSPDKAGFSGYVCVCRNVAWLDCFKSLDRLEEAKRKLPDYIRQIRSNYYDKSTFIGKIARIINHNKNFKGLKL